MRLLSWWTNGKPEPNNSRSAEKGDMDRPADSRDSDRIERFRSAAGPVPGALEARQGCLGRRLLPVWMAGRRSRHLGEHFPEQPPNGVRAAGAGFQRCLAAGDEAIQPEHRASRPNLTVILSKRRHARKN
jgi:hypothetical protein